MNVSAWIHDAKKGKPAAQKHLFDWLAEPMLLVCRRYVKNGEDAEEVMLDGFCKFFSQLSSFIYQSDAALVAFVKRIMINVGMRFVFTNRGHTFKWQPTILWEPHFLFAKDAAGKLQTYRNDFLTIAYGQGGTTDYDARKDFSFSTALSLSYLIRRQGNLVDKHTFRLGIGSVRVSNLAVEPSMYLHDVFRGVTPGIRLSLRF